MAARSRLTIGERRSRRFLPPRQHPNAECESSELLAVAVVDRSGGGSFVSIEGNRRVGQDWTVGVEARAFFGMQSPDPLYALRRDAYVGLAVTRYF